MRDLRFAFDPDLLKVALSNLVQNAIQASTAGQSVRDPRRARRKIRCASL